MPFFNNHISISYFDGAQNDCICGVGMVLKVKNNHSINMWMSVGLIANTKVELLVLWGWLWFAQKRGIFNLQIARDSIVMINRVVGRWIMQVLHHDQWSNRVWELKQWFSDKALAHIYRYFNCVADSVWNKVVGDMDGFMHFEEIVDDCMIDKGSIVIF